MSRSTRKAVTISEVAQVAGVSYQTVSRVVNRHQNVSPATRELVEGIIRDLGYRPNSSARSLVTRRSHRVGLITLGASYYGPAQTITSVETALREDGYTLLFATLSAPRLEELHSLIEQLLTQAVDGLVLVTPLIGVPVQHIKKLCNGVPFVLIDAEAQGDVPALEINQRQGARLGAEHLLALGHTGIAEISGPLHWWDARQRHEGLLGVLAEHGLTLRGSVEGDWGAESGYHAARGLLEHRTDFTALVVGNDQMALGALRGLREHGLTVPGDVSVIGFDDLPEAAYYEPPLTSVRQDFAALGRQCADLIVALMQGEAVPKLEPLTPLLVPRESTTSPKTSREPQSGRS